MVVGLAAQGCAAPPTYVPASGNARGAVHFNGTSSYIRLDDHSALNWGTDDFLLEIVARNTKDAANPVGLYHTAAQTLRFGRVWRPAPSSNDTPKNHLDGDIAEIVAVRGVLPADQRTELEVYLKIKHAVP